MFQLHRIAHTFVQAPIHLTEPATPAASVSFHILPYIQPAMLEYFHILAEHVLEG